MARDEADDLYTYLEATNFFPPKPKEDEPIPVYKFYDYVTDNESENLDEPPRKKKSFVERKNDLKLKLKIPPPSSSSAAPPPSPLSTEAGSLQCLCVRHLLER